MSAISVESLSKAYRIGVEEQRHDTLAAASLSWLKAPFKNFRRLRSLNTFRQSENDSDNSIHWALRDVSFEVKEGEVVGIIGKNGAGKSTLLKILSRITEPTSGRAIIRGRVSSLLEVGTGFHPELSGRENIYMNGTILGMRKREIDRKFDQIVEFSGVSRFIDTPVKRYSSGMKVRLAFAVAAHLEPEILVIDEVLAVGDHEFQQKCLGKMDEVSRSGRTVLFVSHNMSAVEALCNKGVLLEQGRVAFVGSVRDAFDIYCKSGVTLDGRIQLEPFGKLEGIPNPYQVLEITGEDDEPSASLRIGKKFGFRIYGFTSTLVEGASFNLQVRDTLGQRIVTFYSLYQHLKPIRLQGQFAIKCDSNDCRLMPGRYFLKLIVKHNSDVALECSDIPFEVIEADIYGTGRLLPPRTGFFLPDAQWSIGN